MVPSYASGDRVVTFNWSKIGVGDVVAFKSKGKFYIKRVDRIAGGYYHVSGDNKAQSAKFDPVKDDEIVGKVVLKY